MRQNKLQRLILISILAALSFILMLLQFPIPFMPPFLMVDFSDIPAFIGFILLGGMAGSLIIVLKIVLYALLMASEPIGPLANLLAAFSLLLPVYFMYVRSKTRKSLIAGFVLGILSLTFMMAVLNYFVLLPMYGLIIDHTDLIANIRAVVTAGIIPFNLIKGIIVCLVAYLIYIKLIPKLEKLMK
ncbi:ECF transporter S component [Salinicoccus halodurans]|uniref:Riboflavin transporter n=1 Tax=Salinicoccus halodurans TaxID=407035 RepID=A0A0F7D4D9_9STAP|nr:ECF transporter S component [Salinicoccus halodurans]AKG74065.1 riboflavin transporter RibU [Salinicoccus halodurans]SFK59931.1 Riboflavin transporter FmnP [Salinicoccus halodurans]